jgi:predicted site-specific integrase-resolvase
MPKRAKAPEGFYAASTVMRLLDISNATLYDYVRRKLIRRVVPPNREEGYYVKTDVDKLVREKEDFLKKSLEEHD